MARRGDKVTFIADVGATHVRLGLWSPDRGLTAPIVLKCRDFADMTSAIEAALAKLGRARRPAQGAVAGPVTGDSVSITNCDWSFSIDGARRRLGLDRLQVVNDLVAQALALPQLGPQGVEKFGGGGAATDAAMGARGGVYVGGGVVAGLTNAFDRQAFRRRFEDKGRFQSYLAAIPNLVITAPYPALLGPVELVRAAGVS